jgi:hypothetical protein
VLDPKDLVHQRFQGRIGFAVGREAHQLALLLVRLEAGVFRECRIELAE